MEETKEKQVKQQEKTYSAEEFLQFNKCKKGTEIVFLRENKSKGKKSVSDWDKILKKTV